MLSIIWGELAKSSDQALTAQTAVSELTCFYDGPNGSLFISVLLHNSEFRIPKFALRISEFGIVKYI